MRDRRLRATEGVAVVDGPRALATALECGVVVEEIFVRPDRVTDTEALGVTVTEVDPDALDAISETLAVPGISDESKRKIMWDNPARLYGLS